MKTLPKTLFVNIPFISSDRESIRKARLYAKKIFPDAKKYSYIKPEYIITEVSSSWTCPMIQVKTI